MQDNSGKREDGLESLLQEIAECRMCPEMRGWQKFPPSARGTARYRLMIVGEAPGRASLRNSRAFSNPHNLTLRRAFARAVAPLSLIPEDLFYLTDVVKCWPHSPSGANRAPKHAEVNACVAQFLGREMALVSPRLVLTFGRLAATAVLGSPVSLVTVHARPVVLDGGVRVIPLLHPSGANRRALKHVGIDSLVTYEAELAGLLRAELTALGVLDSSAAGTAGVPFKG